MALKVIVKNTFLDVDETEEAPAGSSRRSSSVPRAWKPRSPSSGSPSVASTSASDGELSDGGSVAGSNTPRYSSLVKSSGHGLSNKPGAAQTHAEPGPSSEQPEAATAQQAAPGMAAPAPAQQRASSRATPGLALTPAEPEAQQEERERKAEPDAERKLASPTALWAGKFNPDAVEFKMPCPPPPLGDGIAFMAGGFFPGSWDARPIPTPTVVPSPSTPLNPNARAFKPGAMVFSGTGSGSGDDTDQGKAPSKDEDNSGETPLQDDAACTATPAGSDQSTAE